MSSHLNQHNDVMFVSLLEGWKLRLLRREGKTFFVAQNIESMRRAKILFIYFDYFSNQTEQ